MDTEESEFDIDAFSSPTSRYYNPEVARKLFDACGQLEEFASGSRVFSEGDIADKRGLFLRSRPHRMFLVTEGEVKLTVNGKLIDTIRRGGIFGEMAIISELPGATGVPRTATATASTVSRAYSLDVRETEKALQRAPGFALMLMSVMFERLRFLATRLTAKPDSAGHQSNNSEPIFDTDTLSHIRERLPNAKVVNFAEGARIMEEGAPGSSMYVVLTGRVSIAIGHKVVEKLDPGGVFGEMALVDNSPRTASAVALNDCELLAVDRESLVTMVKSDPAVGMAMMRAVATRIRYMNGLLA